ncbi:MAG: M16 family metallopeptidase [Sphingobacterium sp.]|uniref:M16 family metallopeptidase n=1 Tax=Sphingobacterium sp. JB170 TaxID=1434842 RepID=UPI00097F63CF|nr:pitrilysin family protein [Sphingobacterium sp. JB170]SJN47120.1 ZINC PROTEASE [Sphingobacterium sp. JB170]
MLDRKIAPAQHAINSLSLREPTSVTCKNGLKIFVFPADEMELIKAEFVFDNIFNEPEKPLLNTCLNKMLKDGTTTRTSRQIAEEVDYLGAYLITEHSFDHASLTLYTLQRHITQLLPLVHDVLINSVFPETELDTFKRNNKQALQISLQKNEFLARKLFYNHLFGENRYGITPTESSYDELNRSDLLALYRQQTQPSNCTLFLSGNITPEVLRQVREFFDYNWENTEALPPATSIHPFDGFKSDFILDERKDALQSSIRYAMPSISRTHIDFPAVQFVNTMLGGYFGSRLMRNIREEKGYTYGISSANISLKHGGFFTLATDVGAAVTKATLHEIEQEFDNLRNIRASQEEISLVKNYMLGAVLGSVESIFSHADKFKTAYLSGMSLDYFNNHNEVIRTMDSDRAQQIANKYFDYDRLLKIVVGKLN